VNRAITAAGLCTALLLVYSAAYTAPAKPSFNCARATGQAQELVCADAQLAVLDRELARLYTLAANSSQLNTKQRASLRAYQHGWIKGRNDCWKAADLRTCVLDSYVMRIHELRRDYADARSESADSLSSGPVYVTCQGTDTRMAATFIRSEPPLACLEAQGWFHTLALTATASGAHYLKRTETGGISLWIKGDEARVEMPGQAVMNCDIDTVE
jgi:uncharacterized protein